jgi:hypothetical protein
MHKQRGVATCGQDLSHPLGNIRTFGSDLGYRWLLNPCRQAGIQKCQDIRRRVGRKLADRRGYYAGQKLRPRKEAW